MKNNSNNIILLVLVFLSIGILGFFSSLHGPMIPFILTETDVDYTAIGLLLAFGTAGYLVGTLTGGLLADKLGYKIVFICAYLLTGISAISMKFGNTFILIVLIFFIMQFGLGLFQATCNGLTAISFVNNKAIIFSLLHMFYGIGSMGGVQFSGQLLSKRISWPTVYFWAASLCLIMMVFLLFIKIPLIEIKKNNGQNRLRKIIRDKRLWSWSVFLGGATLLGMGMVNWLPNYLQEIYSFPVNKAAAYLTVFFALYTGSRLFTGFFAEKIGHLKFVYVSMTLSVLTIIIGLSAGMIGPFFMIASGVFIAGLFPTVIVTLTDEYNHDIGIVIGFSIAVARIVAMFGNYIIGIVSQEIGPAMGFAVLPILAFVITAAASIILLNKDTVKIE